MSQPAVPRATPAPHPAPQQSPAVQPCPLQKKPKKPITIRASLFYDGTLNNRANTAARLAYEDRKRKGSKEKSPGSGSFDNDYSNVSNLEKVLADEQPGYDHAIKIYIEGIGTENNQSDTTYGAAVGMGSTGVYYKVSRGLDQLISQIKALVPDPATTKITKLHLDSFGFSRGAAAARHYIDRALRKGKDRIAPRLAAAGIECDEIKMRYCGLFETVASYGTDHTNDTSDLGLDAISLAEKTVQLAAADEHRVNFPLTSIDSAGSGLEIFMPGVHSDVGGGYVDYDKEVDYQVYDIDVAWDGAAEKAALARERNWLIGQGWYHPNEVEQPNFWNEIKVNRYNIRNTYPRIPMQMQAKYAKTLQLVFEPTLEDKYAVPGELSDVRAMIEGKMAKTANVYFNQSWPMLASLRHDYLHFSARYGDVANGPNWSTGEPIHGRRVRVVYLG